MSEFGEPRVGDTVLVEHVVLAIDPDHEFGTIQIAKDEWIDFADVRSIRYMRNRFKPGDRVRFIDGSHTGGIVTAQSVERDWRASWVKWPNHPLGPQEVVSDNCWLELDQ